MGKSVSSRLTTVILSIVASTAWECSTKAAVEVVSFEEPAAPANYIDRQVEIPQFNPSLGSLQSVTIALRETGVFFYGFDHAGGADRQLSGFQDLTMVLETSSGQTLVSLSQRENHPFPPSGHDADPGSHVERVSAAGQKTLGSQQDLMQFTGSGLVDLFLSAQSGRGDHLAWEHSFLTGFWIVDANIKVTYDYCAVPEASTWFAGAFAMLALVLAIGLKRVTSR